jgi:hypothetical protein
MTKVEGGEGKRGYNPLGWQVAGCLSQFRTRVAGMGYPMGDGPRPKLPEVTSALSGRESLMEGIENEIAFREAMNILKIEGGVMPQAEAMTLKPCGLDKRRLVEMKLGGAAFLSVVDIKNQIGTDVADGVVGYLTYRVGNRKLLASYANDGVLRIELEPEDEGETLAKVRVRFEGDRVTEIDGDKKEGFDWSNMWQVVYRAAKESITVLGEEQEVREGRWEDGTSGDVRKTLEEWGFNQGDLNRFYGVKGVLDQCLNYDAGADVGILVADGETNKAIGAWELNERILSIVVQDKVTENNWKIKVNFDMEGEVEAVNLLNQKGDRVELVSPLIKTMLRIAIEMLSSCMPDGEWGEIKLIHRNPIYKETGNDGVIGCFGEELPRWYDNKN